MDLLGKFKQYISKENLFHTKDKLLIAVSGGVDSVVLCELCKQAGFNFVIAHCNFQLRNEESERDEIFVKSLGAKYNVEVLVKKFDTENYAQSNKCSIQVAARELRYTWFHELLDSTTTNHKPQTTNSILTAHHADDNIETLLMNFFKGTGIGGLKGLLPKQNKIIRPLLFARKIELLAYAKTNQLTFVEDSSNISDKYTRNYFRNQLIPDVQKVFPQAEENLINNLQRFREIEQLYQQSILLHKKKLMEQRGNEFHIPVLKLQKTNPLSTVIYEIIKDFGFTSHQTTDALDLLDSESGKFIRSATHRIIKNRNWLIISPTAAIKSNHILIEETDSQLQYAEGMLAISRIPKTINYKLQTTNFIADLDAAKIKFPLLLRPWKHGDYFYPLGMKHKKKLSRFFIDQKLSMLQKEKTWVIETNGKIIWVTGLRIDDRFKITDKTKHILKISLSVSGQAY